MASHRSLGIGVIGLGGMGGRHARIVGNRVKGAHVAAVFDPLADRVGQAVDELGADGVGEPYDVITHDSVDAVVIASPDATHAEFVLACLTQGKPVLCEKPLAQSADEAWQVVAREVELGKRLVQVGFMRRFDPAHVAVKTAIGRARIGRPCVLKGWHRNEASRPGTISERVVTGSLIHDLDSTRWLMEDEINRIYVVGQRVAKDVVAEGEHDLLLAQCELGNGGHAWLEVFVNAAYGYEVGVEIVGSAGLAVTPDEANVQLKHGHVAGTDVAADWLVRFDLAYELQMRAWVSGLHRGEAVTGADAWDGFASLVCADASIASLRAGQVVDVQLPQRPALYEQAVRQVSL